MGVTSWDLGNAIRAARMKNGYTQDKCSELLGITLGHLQQIESGKRNPSVPLLLRIMEALDFSLDALVFPEQAQKSVIHAGHLTEEQAEALTRFLATLK